jgi:hypothetical protein
LRQREIVAIVQLPATQTRSHRFGRLLADCGGETHEQLTGSVHRPTGPKPPLTGVRSNLDYGVLFSESREFVGSAAWMLDTDLNVLPRLRLQVGPQGYLARLAEGQKTDVSAVALGANVRYDLIPRIGLAAFGSGFYSPRVLTFGSAHNLYDFTTGGAVRFASRLTGEAG